MVDEERGRCARCASIQSTRAGRPARGHRRGAHHAGRARARGVPASPAPSVRTAFLCRDKPAMKEVLREAGVPCAQSTGASTAAEVRAFAERGRLPADPQAARRRRRLGHRTASTTPASSSARSRDAGVDRGRHASRSRSSSRATRASTTRSPIGGQRRARLRLALLPERARGDAHALDLAAVHRHQPHRQRAGLRRGEGDGPQGDRRCSASGPRPRTWSGSTGPKGLKFSEIGCRPPGVRAWDLYNAGNDIDLYREWAMAIVPRPPERSAPRAASRPASSRCGPTATAASPATRASTRSASAFGACIIDAHLPPRGHADAAGRGRLHGERLAAHEAPRLRRRCAACSTSSAAR